MTDDLTPEVRAHFEHLAASMTRAEQDAAALDYAENALSEAWMVLRDIAAGHKYPARYAANLLRAHGHNLDGDETR